MGDFSIVYALVFQKKKLRLNEEDELVQDHRELVEELRLVSSIYGMNEMVLQSNLTLLFYVYKRGTAAAAAKSLQSCPTLCDPIDVWQPTRFPDRKSVV